MLDEIVALVQINSALFVIVCGIFGLAVGSFLNVVVYRVPKMLERSWRLQCHELMAANVPTATPTEQQPTFNLAVPGSACPHCGHAIGVLENIPLLSFLAQKGRCKHCGAKISIRYPLVELLTAVLSGIVAWQLGFGLQTLFALFLTWALIALSFIDIDHHLLPDNITLPFVWLGLLLALFGVFTDPYASIIGASAGYLSLWSVYHAFRLLTGKEGMGYGDFKLLALFGAWFGWQYLPLIILLSSLVGALFGVTLILFHRHQRGTPIPFGPYLAIAGWIAMLWGHAINQAYLQAVGLH